MFWHTFLKLFYLIFDKKMVTNDYEVRWLSHLVKNLCDVAAYKRLLSRWRHFSKTAKIIHFFNYYYYYYNLEPLCDLQLMPKAGGQDLNKKGETK